LVNQIVSVNWIAVAFPDFQEADRDEYPQWVDCAGLGSVLTARRNVGNATHCGANVATYCGPNSAAEY
jgi:hypothetical protein